MMMMMMMIEGMLEYSVICDDNDDLQEVGPLFSDSEWYWQLPNSVCQQADLF